MNTSIINLSIDDIKPYHKNAKKHPKDQIEKIANSILEFGFNQPIVVDKENVIIVGHGRYEAGKTLGLKEVPVIILGSVSKEQADAYRLADNKLNESDWDKALVIEELRELDKAGFDIELTGFSRDLIMSDEEKDDEVPEVLTPQTVQGDLYELGAHRLLCGDSTKPEDLAKLMNGNKADLLFTDPPYGVSYEGGHNKKKRKGIIADTLEGDNLTGLFYGALSVAIPNAKDGAAFYVWYASGKSIETYASLSKLPLTLRAVIQWYKVKSGLGAFMSQYIPNCEPCMYLHKTGCSPAWYGPSNEKTVWELKKESRNEFHPTQKPVELPARAIINSSKQEDIVLDQFLGSGSTMIACEKTNRRCYGLELDPRFADTIVQRYVNYTGNTTIKKNGVEIQWEVTKETNE